ncbi:MAG TPA: hypothetical protein VGO41_07015 [Steroidobacteraceae bacterium]|jgi:hypothetical protein|nr:hypothetical protein [Steroidobacteraceae bacterium]
MTQHGTASSNLTLLRALLVPLYPTSLIFISLSSLLFAVTTLVGAEAQLLRLFPTYFLLSMLFNYAYTVLEDVANGLREAPVASVESLGPFELRPILQVTVCELVYYLTGQVGGTAGAAIAGAALLLLPASIGVLGTTGSLRAAINPVTLLQTALRLGWCYPLIVAVAIGCAAGVYALARMSSTVNFIWFLLGELSVLWLFSLIGGAFHLRRLQLGFEPRRSPERVAVVADLERVRLRNRMLDDMFVSIRARKSGESVVPLRTWLAATGPAHLQEDVQAVMTQAIQWNSVVGLAAVTRTLVSELIRRKRPDLAQGVMDQAIRLQPDFTLESAEEQAVITQYAGGAGRKQIRN